MKTWLTLLLCLLLSGTAIADVALKKASFIPLWVPQAQFAGYYMAREKGIYRQHGIDLSIIPGGPGRSPADYLRDGRADFGALWLTTALQRRDEGLKLINVAQIVQQSSMLLIAKKTSGIRNVADLDGHKVGLWGGDFAIPPHALFDQQGIKVRAIPQSTTVNLFLLGGVDAVSAMRYNEYHTILNAGLDEDELRVFSFKDLGINFPEDGLYATENTLRRDPALVEAFVQASLEGWQYAFAHPDETIDVMIRIMQAAKVPANRMHQKWMLAHMQEVIFPADSSTPPGELNSADYLATSAELLRTRLVHSSTEYKDFVRPVHALR